uniref:Ionotropic glutamate receptor C-terminal domain-containing protein n=1 Tax=Timema tahoe TaxID=61484 RepID=A0A7R9IHK4_9NEOP|nr:unnamed protein product [Timema tahoe]
MPKPTFRVYFKLSNAQMTISTLMKVTPWEVFYTLTAIVGVAAVVRGLSRAVGLRGKLGDTWAMFDLLYGFCSQGVPWQCYPTLTSDRIVLGVTQLSGLIVFNIYSATLISKYSVQNDFVMFDTVTELVNSRQYSIGVVQGTADIEILQTLLEGVSLDNILWVDDAASGMAMVCNSSFAFLTTYRLSDNLLTKEPGPPCNPVYLQLSNVKDQLGIGVRKGWPYLRLFNYYLKRLDESGVLVRLQTKWNVRGNEESTERKQKSIDLKQVLPLFLLVCVGLVASWGWLLLEFTANKRNRAARKPVHQRKGTIPLGLSQES